MASEMELTLNFRPLIRVSFPVESGSSLSPAQSSVIGRAASAIVVEAVDAVFGFVVAARVREDALQLEQEHPPEPVEGRNLGFYFPYHILSVFPSDQEAPLVSITVLCLTKHSLTMGIIIVVTK